MTRKPKAVNEIISSLFSGFASAYTDFVPPCFPTCNDFQQRSTVWKTVQAPMQICRLCQALRHLETPFLTGLFKDLHFAFFHFHLYPLSVSIMLQYSSDLEKRRQLFFNCSDYFAKGKIVIAHDHLVNFCTIM